MYWQCDLHRLFGSLNRRATGKQVWSKPFKMVVSHKEITEIRGYLETPTNYWWALSCSFRGMSAIKAEIFLNIHVNKAGTKMRSVPQILCKQAFVCLFKPTFVWVPLIWKSSNKLQFLNEYTRPHLNIHQAATTLNLLTGEVNHILWKNSALLRSFESWHPIKR